MYFLHCSFVAIIFSSLLDPDLPICCPLIAVFWGNLKELATNQWLELGVVRRRGQSLSLPVTKLVTPAGLCPPKQTYRLQPPAHTLVLLGTRAAPPLPGQSCTQNHWLIVACFQRREASLKHELLPTHAVKPFVFMEEDQMMEIMQNLAQQFVTTI